MNNCVICKQPIVEPMLVCDDCEDAHTGVDDSIQDIRDSVDEFNDKHCPTETQQIEDEYDK